MSVHVTVYACSICGARYESEVEADVCEKKGPLYKDGQEVCWLRTDRDARAYATLGKLEGVEYRNHSLYTGVIKFPDGESSVFNANYVHVNVELGKLMKYHGIERIDGTPNMALA